VLPVNWLQHFENIQDYGHFMWLHGFHSGPQFGSRHGELDKLDFQPWERMQNVSWRVTDRGVTSERVRVIPDGRTLRTLVETVLPGVCGVVMLRRLLKQQIDRLATGHDPICTAFEPGRELIELEAGQFLSAAKG
jgi:hypothetical protein